MNTLRLLFQQEAESRLLLTVSRFLASIFLLLLLALPTLAQEVEPTVELGEVEVKADRIIHKTDGLLLYPSEQQKASSRSGYRRTDSYQRHHCGQGRDAVARPEEHPQD